MHKVFGKKEAASFWAAVLIPAESMKALSRECRQETG